MLKYVNKILENHCNKASNESKIEGIGIDSYSRQFKLSAHLSILATGIIKKNDLTVLVYNNGISKSQLSKLNNKRPFYIFEKVFYSLLNTFIKAHRYDVYHNYLDKLYSIMAIDSTFIETMVKGSGIYQREKKRNGLKVHIAAKTGNYALPLKSIITPNVNDSKVFDDLLEYIDEYIFDNTVLTFDLGYYSYGRFRELKEKGINFVSRIKKNADYTVIKVETFNSKIVRFRNGLELRLVSLDIDNKKREYITDMLDIPEIYIYYIYMGRWVIEKLFKNMKSVLEITHLISRDLNRIINQVFATLIAYIVLLVIQSSMALYHTPAEIVRSIRNSKELDIDYNYFNNFNEI
ncbi:IS4 family transposase [Ferroplasma acidiphilum]|uniref:IS4 family transposase n=1 Tax=Ferroplasma acidiphilum TaxID=74969 RepID=A0A7K4FPD1_9ARCH|nr:IS4 family transposase [Ferroplasma acidiphilum]NOL60884.1 IS4 family transposase [Ferroplasma acidiphilum]